MDRIRDQSRLEIHARWMLMNQSLESRRKWIAEYFAKNGPVASIELKQALRQENHKLSKMTDLEKDQQRVADEIEQNKVLHQEAEE